MESDDSPNMRVYDSFLRHHLPKTKENNYADSRNLDCSKKGLRKFVNNKKNVEILVD